MNKDKKLFLHDWIEFVVDKLAFDEHMVNLLSACCNKSAIDVGYSNDCYSLIGGIFSEVPFNNFTMDETCLQAMIRCKQVIVSKSGSLDDSILEVNVFIWVYDICRVVHSALYNPHLKRIFDDN